MTPEERAFEAAHRLTELELDMVGRAGKVTNETSSQHTIQRALRRDQDARPFWSMPNAERERLRRRIIGEKFLTPSGELR